MKIEKVEILFLNFIFWNSRLKKSKFNYNQFRGTVSSVDLMKALIGCPIKLIGKDEKLFPTKVEERLEFIVQYWYIVLDSCLSLISSEYVPLICIVFFQKKLYKTAGCIWFVLYSPNQIVWNAFFTSQNFFHFN